MAVFSATEAAVPLANTGGIVFTYVAVLVPLSPLMSVAFAVSWPSGTTAVLVSVQLPSGCTVVVPITAPLASLTSMDAPFSPVPLMVSVPLAFCVTSSVIATAGAVLSTYVAVSVSLSPLMSVAFTVSWPSRTTAVLVSVQLPSGCTVVVPITAPLASLTSMDAPFSPVPLMVSVPLAFCVSGSWMSSTDDAKSATTTVAVSGAWPLTPVGTLTKMVSPGFGFGLNGGSVKRPSGPVTALTRWPSGSVAVTV